ncbi:MAG: alpha/beta hydrolase [Alphaproteobacteria bacterium]
MTLDKKYTHFSKDELTKEYSPSSMVDDFMVFIKEYIDLSKTEKDNAQNAIFDIPYDNGKNQSIDFFAPTMQNTGYLFVYIHGGYWQELSKNESLFMASTMQKKGLSVAVIDYTLCPDNTVAGIVSECEKAISYLVKNNEQYGFDKNKIIVAGSSAGGHLATMMGLTNWNEYGIEDPICGIVSVSGIYDLTPLVDTYVNDPLKLTYETAKKVSPDFIDKIPSSDIVIAWAEFDTKEFIRQSIDYAEKLSSKGCNVKTLEIKNTNHFNVITDLGKDGSMLLNASLEFVKG